MKHIYQRMFTVQ